MDAKKLKRKTREHARVRAKQRYGINLNRHARKDLIQRIKAGKCLLLEKETNSRRKYLVEFEDQKVIVVYSKPRQEIITLLPFEGKHLKQASVKCEFCSQFFPKDVRRNYRFNSQNIHPCTSPKMFDNQLPHPSWILQEETSFSVSLKNIALGIETYSDFDAAYKDLYESALDVLIQYLKKNGLPGFDESILWIDTQDDYACSPPRRRVTFSSYLLPEE